MERIPADLPKNRNGPFPNTREGGRKRMGWRKETEPSFPAESGGSKGNEKIVFING
jgi:hypothetical protein